MKKKEQKAQGLTLDFLEKKYQEEKTILVKENKKLGNDLNRELERYSQLQTQMSKKLKTVNYQYQELLRENQELKAKILDLQRQEEEISVNEQQQIEALSSTKVLILENQQLQNSIQELNYIVETIYSEKETLKKEKDKISDEARQHLEEVEQKHNQYKRVSQSKFDELNQQYQTLLENKEKEAQKYTDQRNRKKQLERKIDQLERNLNNYKGEEAEEIRGLKEQLEKSHQKYAELTTKLTLTELKASNMEQLVDRKEEEKKEMENKLTAYIELEHELKNKMEKLTAENRHLDKDNQLLRERMDQVESKYQLSKDELLKAMRKSQTEELIGLIRQQNLFSQGNSNHHSQIQVRPFTEQQDRFADKNKLETNIRSLENELAQSKRQMESATLEMNKLKRAIEDKTLELERKESQIKEIRLRVEKSETDRNRELQTLRNENQLLRCRETDKLEQDRQIDQFRTAVSLKLAFYERKIKEHLDTIDRKQTIIEKLQLQKNDMEEKVKLFEDHLKKVGDEMDFLKKYKQDCSRKDELMKDYKVKLEKAKQEVEELRGELSQLKKEKGRLEKQLQSKQQYLSSLKNKIDRNSSEKQEETQKENSKKLSEVKNSFEHKLAQLKRQKQELLIYLQQIREIIMRKVDQSLEKQRSQNKKQVPHYEAAKMLGIKPGELEQFLNPNYVMNKKIRGELQQLWLQSNYSDFVLRFIQFYKNQHQP